MKAAIVFVLTEIIAFTLWALHALPIFGIACCVIGSCLMGLVMGNQGTARKYQPLVEPDLENVFPLNYQSPIEYREPPQGGDATIPVPQWTICSTSGHSEGKLLRERASNGLTQQGRKTTALMKDLDAELEERSDPKHSGAIRWGYTTREVAEGLALIGSALSSREIAGKSDEIYDLPMASYPMEMKMYDH